MSHWQTLGCIIDASTSQLWIRFWLFADKRYIDEQSLFAEDFWEDVFDIIEPTLMAMKQQLKTTKILIGADLLIDGKLMEIVLRSLNMYLPQGYDLEIYKKEELVYD